MWVVGCGVGGGLGRSQYGVWGEGGRGSEADRGGAGWRQPAPALPSAPPSRTGGLRRAQAVGEGGAVLGDGEVQRGAAGLPSARAGPEFGVCPAGERPSRRASVDCTAPRMRTRTSCGERCPGRSKRPRVRTTPLLRSLACSTRHRRAPLTWVWASTAAPAASNSSATGRSFSAGQKSATAWSGDQPSCVRETVQAA